VTASAAASVEATAAATLETTARTAVEAAGVSGDGAMTLDASAGIATMAGIAAISSVAATSVDEATTIEVVGRVEAVAEGVPEQTISGEPGVAEGTACPVPARIEIAVSGVLRGEAHIGVTEVCRAKTAPFIEVIVLGLIFVEALRPGGFTCQDELTAAFDLDGFDVAMQILTGVDGCLTV